MFTGIVQGTAQIKAITEAANFRTHVVEMPQEMLKGLQIGASVAHNGVCLTVTEIKGNLVSFDLMQETLKITNLGALKAGDFVNIERAMQMGTEIGGHILSGHVYCTADIVERLSSEKGHQLLRARLGHPHLLRQVRAQRHAPREKPSPGIIVRLPVAEYRTLDF